MKAEALRELWGELSLIEDWIEGGVRTARPEPDFEAVAEDWERGAARLQAASRAGAREALGTIEAEVSGCAACRLASSGRSRTAFGEGVPDPLVLVVGEGPGAEEDAQGLPFVGPAGKLLDRMLASIGLSRSTNCYIANVVKCRPPENRDPAPDEQDACLGYLRRQIASLCPRYILCVGRVATQALLASKEGINRLRGRWFQFEGVPLLATFHPSALLRDEALKRPAWEDLKVLKARMAADGSLVPRDG